MEFVVSRESRESQDSLGSAYLGEYEGNYGVLGRLQGGFVELVELVELQSGLRVREYFTVAPID